MWFRRFVYLSCLLGLGVVGLQFLGIVRVVQFRYLDNDVFYYPIYSKNNPWGTGYLSSLDYFPGDQSAETGWISRGRKFRMSSALGLKINSSLHGRAFVLDEKRTNYFQVWWKSDRLYRYDLQYDSKTPEADFDVVTVHGSFLFRLDIFTVVLDRYTYSYLGNCVEDN